MPDNLLCDPPPSARYCVHATAPEGSPTTVDVSDRGCSRASAGRSRTAGVALAGGIDTPPQGMEEAMRKWSRIAVAALGTLVAFSGGFAAGHRYAPRSHLS